MVNTKLQIAAKWSDIARPRKRPVWEFIGSHCVRCFQVTVAPVPGDTSAHVFSRLQHSWVGAGENDRYVPRSQTPQIPDPRLTPASRGRWPTPPALGVRALPRICAVLSRRWLSPPSQGMPCGRGGRAGAEHSPRGRSRNSSAQPSGTAASPGLESRTQSHRNAPR